jgi:Iron-containing redox enzyme
MLYHFHMNILQPKNNLNNYITEWKKEYQHKVETIQLFQPDQTFSKLQIEKFVTCFFHLRGHFYKFLWVLGTSSVVDSDSKKIVLANYAGELGIKSKSHDRLYQDFANSLGIDLGLELLQEKYYTGFAKEYNQSHIEFLLTNSPEACWGLFSAYELLDNVDYTNLYNLTQKFTDVENLVFFKEHMSATHFQSTFDVLDRFYKTHHEDVLKGFDFVMQSQLQMWRNLSDYILS